MVISKMFSEILLLMCSLMAAADCAVMQAAIPAPATLLQQLLSNPLQLLTSRLRQTVAPSS